MPEDLLATTFVVKVAERCNLNCSYCYMYNKGDTSYRDRPRFMSAEIAAAMLRRIAAYARRHGLPEVVLGLHGGEPLLVGRQWMSWFLDEAEAVLGDVGLTCTIAVQTNGTLLDRAWLDLFASHAVRVGVSCDGPPVLRDAYRRDAAGRGSYAQVRRALELLAAEWGSRDWGVLTVANPDLHAPLVLEHFLDLGVRDIDFLWPDFHHDDPPPWPKGTLGTYFIELFDAWYDLPSPPSIRWFKSAMDLLLGGRPVFDGLGPQPISDIMVESDGAWEPLDTLRICANGVTRTGLDVRTHDVEAIWQVFLYQAGLHNQEVLPLACRACAFRHVCAGGYLTHRYRRDNGFANPSVHCADLLAVLTHIRTRVAADLRRATASLDLSRC